VSSSANRISFGGRWIISARDRASDSRRGMLSRERRWAPHEQPFIRDSGGLPIAAARRIRWPAPTTPGCSGAARGARPPRMSHLARSGTREDGRRPAVAGPSSSVAGVDAEPRRQKSSSIPGSMARPLRHARARAKEIAPFRSDTVFAPMRSAGGFFQAVTCRWPRAGGQEGFESRWLDNSLGGAFRSRVILAASWLEACGFVVLGSSCVRR
jgi:hypothetical protein